MLAHLAGSLITWVVAGVMLCVWLTWLIGLILAGQLHRLTRPPHGAACACETCVREMERLAGCPTPPPLARDWFKTGEAWSRYDAHRRDLIDRKTHWGFAPERIDPYPPLQHDPEPPWAAAYAARYRRRADAQRDRNLARYRMEAIHRKLRMGQKLTAAEAAELRLWH